MGQKKQPKHLVGVALKYSDGFSKRAIVFLCIISFLCATCNVLLPILEKRVLEHLDLTTDIELWQLLGISILGCVFLMLENFLNIAILMRFRRELESAMEFSLAYKEQPMLQEKGVGVYSSAILGDSEQIGRVLAAGWFSIIFNLVGAIVAIVISATWKHYFLFVAMVSYALILIIIGVCSTLTARYARKEREISYVLGAKVREMVDTNRAIMTYGSYLQFQERFAPELKERERWVNASERAAALSTSMIRMIQMVAVAVFFFFATYELRGISDPSARAATYPTLIALVSYLETIFVPVGALNTTAMNASRFYAFYSSYQDVVAEKDGFGELPENLSMRIHALNVIDNGLVYLSNFGFDVDQVYGIVGMDGEYKTKLVSFLRGESYPPDGHIELGGARIYEIEKNLRLSLLTFNSASNEIYGEGLEFNLTLGKTLLNDAEFERTREEYFASLRTFFDNVDHHTALRHKNKPLTHSVFRDFFALDMRQNRSITVQNDLLLKFEQVKERENFIQTVGASIFASKYARRSRYDKIVRDLGLESYELRDFGVSGRKLLAQDRALLILGRFLLMETENPFVLIDIMGNLPLHSQKAALKHLKEALHDRRGIIFESNLDALHTLSDSIVYFEEGYIRAIGPHSQLMRKCKPYHDLYTKNVASGKKS